MTSPEECEPARPDSADERWWSSDLEDAVPFPVEVVDDAAA